ncbi:uncharacterized protein LOC121636162 [Melanotaenia boesemani]|uniref:uncharacterized protein LOC121636162 n=1 Tax=Melanotaenia boesemani TaxID=1250792 RepID=UPI001C052D81|nr:uncharacterized protein LOC121636162 [Melanotaenia boesemani]
MSTPQAIVGIRHPHRMKEIQHMSEKWCKRTKNLINPWPVTGSFDPQICELMQHRIEDYKAENNSKKRQKKRQLELEILNLFKISKPIKRNVKTIVSFTDSPGETGNCTNAELFPNLTGTIKFDGDFNLDDQQSLLGGLTDAGVPGNVSDIQNRLSAASGLAEKGPPTDALPQPDPPNFKQRGASLQGTGEAHAQVGRHSTSIHSPREKQETPPHLAIPKYCSTQRRQSGIINCYQDRTELARKGKTDDSFWMNLGPRQQDLQRELGRSQIVEMEQEIDDLNEEVEGATSGGGVSMPACLQKPGTSTGVPRDEYDLRYRPNIRPPDRLKGGEFPILIRGTRADYHPFSARDLTGLVSELPQISAGGGKWIKALESNTAGTFLSLGDIKAVLAQVLGLSKMQQFFRDNELDWILSERADGTELAAYKGVIWQGIRKQYPNKIDVDALKGEPLKDDQNPAAYIDTQLKRWRQESQKDVENDPILLTLFRNAVIDSMPKDVSRRLEDVVGLTSMPAQQFRDHVVHAVTRYRKDLTKTSEQDLQIQRKLAQMQLNDLQGKLKEKVQAVVFTDPGAGRTAGVPESTQAARGPQPFRPSYSRLGTPSSGAWQGSLRCWYCGMFGHFAKACPRLMPLPAGGPGRNGGFPRRGGPLGGPRPRPSQF